MLKLYKIIACALIVNMVSAMQKDVPTGQAAALDQNNKKKSETVKQLESLNQTMLSMRKDIDAVRQSIVLTNLRLEMLSKENARATNRQADLWIAILNVLSDAHSPKISGETRRLIREAGGD